MIIWIASYPRSGNALLRTLLSQHFHLLSATDEPMAEKSKRIDNPVIAAALGYREISENFDEFYEQANSDGNINLIKTHRPPIDRNKVIYVVRDGRKACLSYVKFHAAFNRDNPKSLLNLVMGQDFYGGWSEHFRLWTTAGNPLLLLRYEELIAPDQATIEKIASFLDVPAPDGKWTNPFAVLQKERPDLIREGKPDWQGSEEWSELIDAIFFSLHGKTMLELGYADKARIEQASSRLPPEVAELLKINMASESEKNYYRKICEERLTVIEELKHACDERLHLIEELHTIAEERLHAQQKPSGVPS